MLKSESDHHSDMTSL